MSGYRWTAAYIALILTAMLILQYLTYRQGR